MPALSKRSITPAGNASTTSAAAAKRHHCFQDDLVACAHRQLLFLTLIHSKGISVRRPKAVSLHRYVHLWLPMVAKHNNPFNADDDAMKLIPPGDVSWLWHVHRLAPSQYKHHIRSTGLVEEKGYLDANPPFALQFAGPELGDGGAGGAGTSDNTCNAANNTESLFDDFDIEAASAAPSPTDTAESATRELWMKEYPSEPFFLEDYDGEKATLLADELALPDISTLKIREMKSELDSYGVNWSAFCEKSELVAALQEARVGQKSAGGDDAVDDGDDDTLVSGYDLLAAAERQATFFWQVSRSCFRQDKFLHEGVDRYHKFLLLWKSAKEIHSLIPTYQIDLIWHSHMLSSTKKYDEDCQELIGCDFDHDDSLDDRSKGSTESIAFNATKSLWERTYGTKYVVRDAMYRGPPPPSYFSGDGFPHQHSPEERYRKVCSIPSTSPHATPTSTSRFSPQARFAHAIGLHRLSPSEVRRESHTSTYSRIQCKFVFFGISLIGLSFFPLFYPDDDCSDCAPCPDDNKENSRPEDFAFRIVIASLCLIPGTFLLSFAALWKFGIISLSDECLGCLISNCKGEGGSGGGAFGGGCGGGGCGC